MKQAMHIRVHFEDSFYVPIKAADLTIIENYELKTAEVLRVLFEKV